jgi:hypothetical protein
LLLIPFLAFFNLFSNWDTTLYGEVRGASDFRRNIYAMGGALIVTSVIMLALFAKTFGCFQLSLAGGPVRYGPSPMEIRWKAAPGARYRDGIETTWLKRRRSRNVLKAEPCEAGRSVLKGPEGAVLYRYLWRPVPPPTQFFAANKTLPSIFVNYIVGYRGVEHRSYRQ